MKSIYVFVFGDCTIYSRKENGMLLVRSGDDLPEDFLDGSEEGVKVFDGVVIDPREHSVDALDAMGIPVSAKEFHEWWHGIMRPATDEEILAVLGNNPWARDAKPFPNRSSAPETQTAPVEAGAVNSQENNNL